MSRFGNPFDNAFKAHESEERMRRILAVPVRYTRCADATPIADGEYIVDGRRIIVATVPHERVIVDRDPGDESP